MMNLKNKVAVVTGASRGIGKAIALRMASEGIHIVLVGRNEHDLRAVSEQSSSSGVQVLPVVADIRKPGDVQSLAKQTLERFQAAHFLINNAGVGRFAEVASMSDEDFHTVIETNLYGAFYCARAFLPQMIKQQEGHIVNISSLAGKNSFVEGSAYCASKHALNSFAECLMLEVRHHNIKVSTIAPGSVQTEFSTESSAKSWALTSDDVAEAVMDVLVTTTGSLISMVEMRPLKPKKR